VSPPRFALGFALYHRHDLSRDPAPLAALLERPVGDELLEARLTRVRTTKAGDVKFGAARKYRREELLAAIGAGEVGGLILSSPSRADGSSAAGLYLDTPPERALSDEERARACPYLVKATFDGEELPTEAAEEALVAAFVSFAEALGARAGVVLVAGSVDDAYTAVTGAGTGSSTLGDEEKARARRALSQRDELGRVARAPEWGTLLSAEHLRALGGEAWLGRQECARVVQLAHGAVFLQLTRRGEELAGAEARARRARLEQAMAPVLAG
jgi:hypothetical protein